MEVVLNKFKKSLVAMLCLLSLGLQSCSERLDFAPVSEGHAYRDKHYYTVKAGDTLYSIAWRYDKDFRELAYYNHLSDSSELKPGQKIILDPKKPQATRTSRKKQLKPIIRETTPVYTRRLAKRVKKRLTPRRKRVVQTRWYWPAKGRVVKKFSIARGSKGIDIKGAVSSSVNSARAGRVAYSGSGLRGYGNLVIIKHNNEYLSAYAFNRKNLVKEGQFVKANQKIAEMGGNKGVQGLLHFEIRRAGRPVNPLKLLR